ncbi:hypothetical protein [Changpingibacter yushuensis]|uniref:hypothetical protein n=1 Tax=Changpingibacter yushuensis TaxID=2758440 RepID=UPI0015F6E544|nr:hypothetical protein [Changpingibacter yushuensis]
MPLPLPLSFAAAPPTLSYGQKVPVVAELLRSPRRVEGGRDNLVGGIEGFAGNLGAQSAANPG